MNIFVYSFTPKTKHPFKTLIDQGITTQLGPPFQCSPNVITLGLDIETRPGENHLRQQWLARMLRVLLDLQTINHNSIRYIEFPSETFFILTRFPNMEWALLSDPPLPAIRTIQMWDITIKDPEAFKAMILAIRLDILIWGIV